MRIFNPTTSSGGEIGATGPQGIQGPGGGGGSGGLMFYLNQNTAPDSTTGLPTTSTVVTGFAVKELGRIADTAQTTITTEHLPTNAFNLVAGFVSDVQDPNITAIPPGLWDLNFWASSTANTNNQTVVQVKAYIYNGITLGAPFATSDELYIYDPTVVAQYTANLVVGSGVTITSSDRIYIEILAKGSSNNYTLTLKFGAGTPTHLHTTIPSVSGTGIVKVVDGLPQTPASLIVNADVALDAAISVSKINGAVSQDNFNLSMHIPSAAIETLPRNRAFTTTQAPELQIPFTMFTPVKDTEVNTIGFLTGSTVSSVTSGYFGVYSFNESTGIATRLATTSNLASEMSVTTLLTKSLNSTVQLIAGNRYAVCMLFSGSTKPNFYVTTQAAAFINAVTPVVTKIITVASSTLPATIDLSSAGSTAQIYWARLSKV